MKIAAMPPMYPPESRVGAWLATHEFMRALAERGHEVYVVPEFGFHLGEDFDLDGVRVLPSRYRMWAAKEADVMVSHLGSSRATDEIAFSAGKPTVKLAHSSPSTGWHHPPVDLLVCNSEATKALISPKVARQVVVCQPPTRVERYVTTPGDRVTLVNLSAAKGGDTFWRLAMRMPDVQFLGVRGGHGFQVIERRWPNVEIIESTENMRDEVYARTKILLMPSRFESWGMVAMEAMASGIPVLASPTAGLRECLGEAGTCSRSLEIGAWMAELRSLLTPERWALASAAARARAESFDAAGSCERFVTAVEALAR